MSCTMTAKIRRRQPAGTNHERGQPRCGAAALVQAGRWFAESEDHLPLWRAGHCSVAVCARELERETKESTEVGPWIAASARRFAACAMQHAACTHASLVWGDHLVHSIPAWPRVSLACPWMPLDARFCLRRQALSGSPKASAIDKARRGIGAKTSSGLRMHAAHGGSDGVWPRGLSRSGAARGCRDGWPLTMYIHTR